MDSTGKWFLSALFNFRSQFFDGFNYATNHPELSSSFMAPGYFIFSLGFDYKPSSKLSVFLSPITSRYTVVTNKELNDKLDSIINEFKNKIKELINTQRVS
jgi:hypothetical protein